MALLEEIKQRIEALSEGEFQHYVMRIYQASGIQI